MPSAAALAVLVDAGLGGGLPDRAPHGATGAVPRRRHVAHHASMVPWSLLVVVDAGEPGVGRILDGARRVSLNSVAYPRRPTSGVSSAPIPGLFQRESPAPGAWST